MHYKITNFGACAPYPYVELHRLFRKERKMKCHQNPGPDHYYVFTYINFLLIEEDM